VGLKVSISSFQTYPRGVEAWRVAGPASTDVRVFQTYPRGVEVDGFDVEDVGDLVVSDVPSWGWVEAARASLVSASFRRTLVGLKFP